MADPFSHTSSVTRQSAANTLQNGFFTNPSNNISHTAVVVSPSVHWTDQMPMMLARQENRSMRAIARHLDRPVSTVSREIQRYGLSVYDATQAARAYAQRRQQCVRKQAEPQPLAA